MALVDPALVGKDRYATEYEILASAAGKDDSKTIAHETNAKAGKHAHAFAPTPARYVSVHAIKPDGTDQPGGQMGITELEVHGGRPAARTAPPR